MLIYDEPGPSRAIYTARARGALRSVINTGRSILPRTLRGVGIGGATGARAPHNFPVGGLKITKLVGLDTVAALIIMRSNALGHCVYCLL